MVFGLQALCEQAAFSRISLRQQMTDKYFTLLVVLANICSPVPELATGPAPLSASGARQRAAMHRAALDVVCSTRSCTDVTIS